MAEILAFKPRAKPDPKKLTVVFDDISAFCKDARIRLHADRNFSQASIRMLLGTQIATIAGDVALMADKEASLILGRHAPDDMQELGERIAKQSNYLLDLLETRYKSGEIATLATLVFTRPQPEETKLSLAEKRALLSSFKADRLAAYLA